MSVSQLEPWLTKDKLAEELGCSVSWIEKRMREGLPSTMMAGRRKFKRSKVERWMEKEGHLVESAA